MMKLCRFLFLFVLINRLVAQQWQATYGPAGNTPWDLKNINNVLYMAADWGNYRSTDNGANWSALDLPYTQHGGSLTSFWPIDNKIYFRNYVSADGGNTWSQYTTDGSSIMKYLKLGSAIVRLSEFGGPFYSVDNGNSWIDMKRDLPSASRSGMAVIGDTVYVAVEDTVFATTLNGTRWGAVGGALPTTSGKTMTAHGGYLYYGTTHGLYRWKPGGSWVNMAGGAFGNGQIFSIFFSPTHIYLAAFEGLYRADINSTNWQRIPDKMGTRAHAVYVSGTTVYAGFNSRGLYKTNDLGVNWTVLNKGIFAGHKVDRLASSQGKVWSGYDFYHYMNYSSDHGDHWNNVDFNYQVWWPSGMLCSIFADGNDLYYGESNGYIYYSHDGGVTMHVSDSSMANPDLKRARKFVKLNNNVYVLHHNMLLRSSNRGVTWTAVTGLPASNEISDIAASSGAIFVAVPSVDNQKIYRSLDGSSWTQVHVFPSYNSHLEANGNKVYAFYDYFGMYTSSDNGLTWSAASTAGLPGEEFWAATATDGGLYVATISRGDHGSEIPEGIYYYGAGSWQNVSGPLQQRQVNCLAADQNYIYAGVYYDGVYRMAVNSTQLASPPEEFAFTIYPNPGMGKFQIRTPKVTSATIKVYNSAGQCLSTSCMDGMSGEIDLAQKPKGIYIVELATDKATHAQKIILEY